MHCESCLPNTIYFYCIFEELTYTMNIQLMDLTPDAEQKIAKYAAICYDSSITQEANDRRVKHLMKVGHLATLRFASATFLISGISRACSHQLVRHPHLSYLQRSQRYVNETGFSYVKPEFPTERAKHTYESLMSDIAFNYEWLINQGMRKEDARFILPNAATTEMYVTGNLQAWKEACELRTSPKAQWEIRGVFTKIQNILKKECPNIFGDVK